MCTTTNDWRTHISNECSRGGSAICDGYCMHGDECTCVCHHDEDLPQTIVGVQEYHDEFWDVVQRFTGDYTSNLSRWQEARYQIAAKHGGVWKGVRGARFRLFASDKGYAYIYVEFS